MKPDDIAHDDVLTVLRQPRRIEPVRATCVLCLAGTAWITIEGQRDDVILFAGDSHCVQPRQKALLAGMPMCRVVIAAAAVDAGMRR